jgi:drug/metabolite transporter (DMT)-like permease
VLFRSRLLAVYPSWAVASFSFLTPLVAAGLGWAVLSEPVSPTIFAALAAVALGIVLINRPARLDQTAAPVR